MTKFETLPRAARRVIENLFCEGSLTRGAALASLEDGEYLAALNASEAAADAAYAYIEALPGEEAAPLFFYWVGVDALREADAFDYNDEALERALLDRYSCHELGVFATDAEAIAAAEVQQKVDDAEAERIGQGARGPAFKLEGGPVYREHVMRWDGGDGVKVWL